MCSKGGGKMDKRNLKSKQKLRNALISLMKEYELSEIQVSSLVKEAGCSRSTFYNYYDSVESLLFETIDETLEEIKIHIRNPYKHMKNIEFTKFPKENVTLFTYLKDNRDLFAVLMKESKLLDLNRFIADTIEELYVEEYDFLLNNSRVDPKLFKIYAANGITAIILRWMETGYKESPDLLVEQAIELLKTSSSGFIFTMNC